MTESEKRFDEVISKLRERRCRMTPQRVALLRILTSTKEHPSAAQLHEQLRTQFPTTSLATVYKTLNLLDEMDEVLEMGFSGDDRRYDGFNPRSHPHLVCVGCRRIVDLEGTVVDTMTRDAADRSGFRVIGHRLDVYGLCPSCQARE
jgi:Fur family transcriptional regulator, peroxide stress response regulator